MMMIKIQNSHSHSLIRNANSDSDFKSNQIRFISLKNSMNIITVERITVSRNSKGEVALDSYPR